MKKKVLSLALALILVLALVPVASAAEDTPVFVDGITVEVPAVSDMTITMSHVFDNYFYRDSDGAVLFLFAFPDDDEKTKEPFYPIIFDKDVTLKPMSEGLTMWAGFDGAGDTDISVTAGRPVDTGLLRHCYTTGGTTVNFLGIDQLPPQMFIYGTSGVYGTGYEGLAKELEAVGFKMLPISGIAASSNSTDVPSAWAVPEVNAAIEAGLVPENLQKNYKSDVTREAIATLFINVIEQASGMSIDEFMAEKGVEVNPNAYSDTNNPSILAADALGILRGVGDGRFNPNGNLLRSHIATVVGRVARTLGVDTEGYTHAFADLVGHWAEAEVGWAVHMNIIRGVSDTEFNPEGNLTTEQLIAMANRTLEALS